MARHSSQPLHRAQCSLDAGALVRSRAEHGGKQRAHGVVGGRGAGEERGGVGAAGGRAGGGAPAALHAAQVVAAVAQLVAEGAQARLGAQRGHGGGQRHHAHGEHVEAPLEMLRRGAEQRAAALRRAEQRVQRDGRALRQRRPRARALGAAKVDELELRLARHQDVARLDVAVHKARAVQLVHGVQQRAAQRAQQLHVGGARRGGGRAQAQRQRQRGRRALEEHLVQGGHAGGLTAPHQEALAVVRGLAEELGPVRRLRVLHVERLVHVAFGDEQTARVARGAGALEHDGLLRVAQLREEHVAERALCAGRAHAVKVHVERAHAMGGAAARASAPRGGRRRGRPPQRLGG